MIPQSLRPWTYCTLFSLLAVTGLRISEALALTLDDVTADGLVIRKTKFQKTRLVPLHDTTQAGLDRYLTCRRHVLSNGANEGDVERLAGWASPLMVRRYGRSAADRRARDAARRLARGDRI